MRVVHCNLESLCVHNILTFTGLYVYFYKKKAILLSAHEMGGTCVMSNYSIIINNLL